MLKKFVSILMLYSALAILLGHNCIVHQHDFEQGEISIHHNDGHQHHDADNKVSHHHAEEQYHNNDSEAESDIWKNIFANLQHGEEGLSFINLHGSDNFSIQIPEFTVFYTSIFIIHKVILEVRQNAPPYITDYYNSHNIPPSGQRAPPIFIV